MLDIAPIRAFAYRGRNVEFYEPVIVLRPEMIELHDGARVDSFVKIEGGNGVYVGRYVHIPSFAHVNVGGGYVELRDYSALGSGTKIMGGANDYKSFEREPVPIQPYLAGAPPGLHVVNRMRTIIKSYAWVCAGAIVLGGLTIGEGAVIGAGSVVTRDVPAWQVWAGNPARYIRERPRGSVPCSR